MPKPLKEKVARHRARKRAQKKQRLELTTVPEQGAYAIRDHAEAVKIACARGAPVVSLVVKTINAPLPHPVDPETVLAGLVAWRRRPTQASVMMDFFKLAPMETLHDLVLAGAVTFEDLRHALHIWVPNKKECPHAEWIEEMADLALARDAA